MAPPDSRVLITGAGGFIGRGIFRHFEPRVQSVLGLTRQTHPDSPSIKVTNYEIESLVRTVAEFDPHFVVHAAGPASVSASLQDPFRDFEMSVLLLARMLEAVRRSGRKPVIVFLSSAAVYGEPLNNPVPETAPLRPLSPYGYHKHLCELLLEEHFRVWGISSISARLFSVFGPEQKRLLVWELFQQFQTPAGVVKLRGTGDETRDYIHIDDLADRLLRAMVALRGTQGNVALNLASGEKISTRDLAVLMKRLLKADHEIRCLGEKLEGNPAQWNADISSYRKITGEGTASYAIADRLQSCLEVWAGQCVS